MMKAAMTTLLDTTTSLALHRRELNDVEIRRQIEEHMEKQRAKAIEGDLADLY